MRIAIVRGEGMRLVEEETLRRLAMIKELKRIF
jgi:hypothetical protein